MNKVSSIDKNSQIQIGNTSTYDCRSMEATPDLYNSPNFSTNFTGQNLSSQLRNKLVNPQFQSPHQIDHSPIIVYKDKHQSFYPNINNISGPQSI